MTTATAASTQNGRENMSEDMKCRYRTGKCKNQRAMKQDGMLHNLCELHRQKANESQRKLDRKKQEVRNMMKTAPQIPRQLNRYSPYTSSPNARKGINPVSLSLPMSSTTMGASFSIPMASTFSNTPKESSFLASRKPELTVVTNQNPQSTFDLPDVLHFGTEDLFKPSTTAGAQNKGTATSVAPSSTGLWTAYSYSSPTSVMSVYTPPTAAAVNDKLELCSDDGLDLLVSGTDDYYFL